MLQHEAQLQDKYLQTLLQSRSPEALKISEYAALEIQKCQDNISHGRMEVSAFDPDRSDHERDTPNPRDNNFKPIDSILVHKNRSLKKYAEAKLYSKEEHEKVVRGIIEQKRNLNKGKEDRKREEEEERLREEDERKQLLEEQKLEREIEKKRNLEDRINDINQKGQKRKNDVRLQNKIVGKLLTDLPLHQKLEKNFMMQEAQSLEEKKKRLAQIRSLHKPVTKEDLMEHEKKINELKERIPKRDIADSRVRSSSLLDIYKSDFYKKASQENPAKELERMKEQKAEQAYEFQQKIKEYNRYVKGNFKPQIDDRLVNQLKNQTSVDIRKPMDNEELKQRGQDYLQFNIANKKDKTIINIGGHTEGSPLVQENKSQKYQRSKMNHPNTERLSLREIPKLSGPVDQKIESVYLRKKKESSRRSKSQFQEDMRYIRHKEQDIDEIMDEGELDKLYDKIMKVKMSMEKPKK